MGDTRGAGAWGIEADFIGMSIMKHILILYFKNAIIYSIVVICPMLFPCLEYIFDTVKVQSTDVCHCLGP